MSEYFQNRGFDDLRLVEFDDKLSYARSLAFYTGIIQFGLGVLHISNVANYLSGILFYRITIMGHKLTKG